ncbi:MAG: ester cyclase [Anaerolineae bacterium]|jgi:steroid delta-isomerase-like uncharacterized protein|nr:ester cyclase [Anaerolineae bacterium]
MSETPAERLRAIALRWMEEGWQKGNAAIVDELHAEDFVDHDSAGRAGDREGFKEGIRALYAAFPDFYATTEGIVIDVTTGSVAVRWSATGTQQGMFMGVPPTGKRFTFVGIEIIRIEDDHIVERWGQWDGGLPG